MSNRERADNPSQCNWQQFSVRSVLVVMLLVATYIAGWLSHKQFNNRNLDENVSAAVKRIDNMQAQVEVIDELDGLTVVRGKRSQDVKDVISAIEQVKDAAEK